MKFITALPTNTVSSGPSNVLSPVQGEHITPPLVEGQKPYVLGVSQKNVTIEAARLNKRATLIVDIWADVNQGGRHEGLATNSMYSPINPVLRHSQIMLDN